jgi:hypothetical protein
MKLSKEIINGLIIGFGIAILFLIINLFGLEKIGYLRVLNGFVVLYGIYRTQKMNSDQGIFGIGDNLVSMIKTGVVGVIISTIGLAVYATINGGKSYLETVSYGYLFGKNPSVNEYCFGILIEGIASVIVISLILMQSAKIKSTKNN